MNKRLHIGTTVMQKPVPLLGCGSIVGPNEGEGPNGEFFDRIIEDDLWGEDSWEKAESKLFYEAVRLAVKKSHIAPNQIDYVLGGDLLNQMIATSFAVRQMDIPFIGLYSACSTIAVGMSVAAMLIDGGFASFIACCACSHFSTAERQFRTPLEMGVQRTPTAQRTVTGAGSVILGKEGDGPYITHTTIGRILDYGIKDAHNMGGAMAPAAADTISRHLQDTGRDPQYYDTIITGDLGILGLDILNDQLLANDIRATDILRDCGAEMFHPEQDAHMGGSGCACSATTLCAKLIPQLRKGVLQRILFVPTGALLSTVSTMQGESIPSVAHAVAIERSV